MRATAATATLPSLVGLASGASVTATDHRVPSFDGAELAVTVYTPDGDGQHPVILSTHGWGGDRGSGRVTSFGQLAAENGYVAVTWDQRGFGESDGEVGLSGPKEVKDAQWLVDWVAHGSPHADRVATPDDGEPRVGMVGASYGGGIQLNTAAVDDRIRALVPIVPWHDLTFSLAPNGVPKLGWTSLLYGAGIAAARGLQSGDGQPNQRDLGRGVSPRLHEIYTKTLARNELPPEGRSFLKVRSAAPKIEQGQIDAPTMVVQGWPDTLFVPNEGQRIVDGLRANQTEAKLVLFNGGHTVTGTAEPSEQVADLETWVVDWFDEHLKGEAASTADWRRTGASYWDVQRGGWHHEESFPPAEATERSLPLSQVAGSGSTPIANTAAPTSASQISPQNADLAPDASAAQFDFPVLENATVVGTPTLSLSVTPLGTRAFLFAKLSHVSDGEATLINNQAMPVAIEGAPGEEQEIELDLVSIQRHLDAGNALRLTLATTDAGFTSARQAAGVQVAHDSTLAVDVRGSDAAIGGVTVTGTRTDDGSLFTGGQTDRVTLDIDTAGRSLLLRDTLPEGWSHVGGDGTQEGRHVVFGRRESPQLQYFAEAPADPMATGRSSFGPAEYSLDGETWLPVPGTADENVVLGVEQP